MIGSLRWLPVTSLLILSLACGGTVRADESTTLRLGEVSFDPLLNEPEYPPGWEPIRAAGADLQLVQAAGPIRTAWLDRLEQLGLEPIQYIHPYSYIVWGTSDQLSAAREEPWARWTGPFAPAYRVLPRWRNPGDRTVPVRVLLYRGADLKEVRSRLADLAESSRGGRVLDDRLEILGLEIPGNRLAEAARLPGVYSIQPIPTDGGLRGEMSNQVCAGNMDPTNLAYPGYPTWLEAIGLDGSGVIMANVDGGVDQAHLDLAGRMLPCTGQTCAGGTASDHGTHTAGIMAADGASGTTDGYGFLRALGMAPGAQMVEQVYSPWYTQPGGMTLLIEESSENQAVLSGNSWGPSGSPLGYDADTLQVDIGVRDAQPDLPGSQPFSYVLSIMNGYGGTSSQGTPDEGKNMLTVGSTKLQTSGGAQYLEIDDLSSNSAHGPCLDGRTIPHLVAPGCYVDSSTYPSDYGLNCGTSMASPHVAGAAALFIQRYRELTTTEPSPAMIKAAFLVAARDLAGHEDADGSTMGHPFDSKQGWGRMDAAAVLDPVDPVLTFDQTQVLDETGQSWERTVYVADPARPLRVMLVWTDAPGHGLGGSTPAWNNDLDLVVEHDGWTYPGNRFDSSGWSVPGGPADGMNNTEGVFLGPAVSGTATVRVEGTNISSDGIPGQGDGTDQDFALVVMNALDQSPDGAISLDRGTYTVGVEVLVRVSDLDLHGAGQVTVTLESDSEPVGEPVILTEIEPDSGILEGSLATTGQTGQPGLLTIAHGDEIRGIYHDADTGSGLPGDKVATAQADLEGPVISDVTVAEQSSTGARITWSTDEPASSTVWYGINLPPDLSDSSSGRSTEHEVELTELVPCTWYRFAPESADEAGNVTLDDAGGSYYLFATHQRVVLIDHDMETDPGWETEGEWAWGAPTGQGGDHGNPDPSSGFTGPNVVGYNLNGDYSNEMVETHLTTPSFDCSGGTGVALIYQRWLGVERDEYDHAYLRISTNGGSSWHDLWQNGSESLEGGVWEEQTHDLAAWADGESDVRLRWTMGATDIGWTYCGWNIDDVRVSFETECAESSPTPLPTGTSSPKPTTTPTSDPTATPTPERTIPPFGVRLDLPHRVSPGETFHVTGFLDNPDPPRTGVPVFFVLEVQGQFWFWPGWVRYYPPEATGIDYRLMAVTTGTTEVLVLPTFTWPDTGDEEGMDLRFIGAMLNPAMTAIEGAWALEEWSYGPSS